MTREQIDAYVGRRARVLRADGKILIGTIKEDSVARFAIVGTTLAHLIRYDHVLRIEPVGENVPNSD